MKNEKDTQKLFTELVSTMQRLRAPEGGCSWDKAQTHETLIKCLQEESGEVIEAIRSKDDENLQEELGDLLLQVLFHAEIAQEEGRFTLADIIDGLNQKLIRRHPHVFGGATATSPEHALEQWKAVKEQERAIKEQQAKIKGKK